MSPGAPACDAKKTLWGTGPNAKVTVWPAWMVTDGGVNDRSAVAATVALPDAGGAAGAGAGAGGAAVGGPVRSPPPPLEPQADVIRAPVSMASMSLVDRVNM